MFIKYIIFLTLVSNTICVLVPLIVQTTLIELNISILEIDIFDFDKGPIKTITTNSKLDNTANNAVPVDDGYSNFGDLIHLKHGRRDILVFSEVFTNDPGSDTEANLHWSAQFPGYVVTQVRVLNLGRQRAFCSWIGSGGDTAQAGIYVPPNVSYRLLIDVYARKV